MPRLINLGSLCIDNVYGVPNVAAPGETVASSDPAVFPGGKGLNQSLAAAKAGARVVHVGCIGRDGRWLKAELASAGVDVERVRETDMPSGHAVIQVTPQGENAIVFSAGANRALTAADVEAAFALCEPEDWLLLQNEINELEYILSKSHDVSARIAFNVAPVDGRELHYDLSSLDLLIVNEVEAAALAGTANPRDALEVLCDRYPACRVVLTLGRDGLRFGCGSDRIELDAFAVAAVDETAAGDAFVGYFMAALLEGRTLEDALVIGSAAGALAVTQAGAASSIPQRDAVRGLADGRL